MKMPLLSKLCWLCLLLMFIACSSSQTISRDKKKILEMRTIAILPVEVIHLGRLHEVDDQSENQQLGIEREGFILQRDIYRYFLRGMKEYELERTYLQDLKITNDLLKDLEEKSASKIELSVREISEWLGVDGILTISIDQLAPGNALMAGFMNGRLSNESNVSISMSLRSKYGQIYWRYKDEKPTNTEAVYEHSKELLKQATKTFFSLYPSNKPERKKKLKKKLRSKTEVDLEESEE